uniref:Uncharacterized protein n=1 Tax=Acanthochromis polyacanthus TaxID=80966 RepID=A0A3Q1FGN6_9TELE
MDVSESNLEAPRPPSDITVFGANCTLHGLSHIFLPGGVTIRRLLWAAAFSSSLSIFLLQVADRVIEYYRYPHVTILDEMDSPVMYFPAITICNYNSFRKSQIRRNDIFWMAGMLGVEQGDFDDFMAAIGQPSDNSKFFPSKTFNMLEFVAAQSMNREGRGDKIKPHSANNEINKSEAVSADDRPDNKYLMCLFHYSVSVKANVGVTVTVSAVLAVRSMALRRNTEGIH